MAQLGPDEFLVTGVDASVNFHLPGKLPWIHSQIVSAEQGTYENGVWKPLRLWNGDETTAACVFTRSRRWCGSACNDSERVLRVPEVNRYGSYADMEGGAASGALPQLLFGVAAMLSTSSPPFAREE